MTLRMNLGQARRLAELLLLALVTGGATSAAAQGVSGEGFGALVDSGGNVAKAAGAVLPAGGGIGIGDLDAVGLVGSVTSGWATTVTTGAVGAQTVSAQTISSVENLSILGGLLTAKFVNAVSSSTADGTKASSNALGSVLTDLVINGTRVGSGDLMPAPNTRIELPALGYAVLNEQKSGGDGVTTSGLSVTMIHVVLLDALTGAKTGEILVGSASSAASF
jgi:hypothetical protein